ncbi:MAG: hypothetical protein ACRDB0_07365, partial [Paraclostridium sp.]
KREKEEYAYNLKRERAIENDKWEDEKAERESLLSKKELEVALREELAEDALKELEELKVSIENLKQETTDAYARGLEEGKKKAATSHAIEVNHLKKEHQWALEKSKSEIDSLENQLNSEKANHALTNKKLDEAYAQITNTAMAVANAGVKVSMDSNK